MKTTAAEPASTYSESARQWVHIGSASFALLLRVLTWREAAACALAALAFNTIVLPHVGGRRLYRAADEVRGFPLGIVLYPIAVLLLIVAFGSRLDLAAAGWTILAFGDGAATLVGRRIQSRRWPWNPEKSVAGTLAFILFGGVGAALVACWTRPAIAPPPSVRFEIAAPMAAAIAAALVETIPIRLDDNISVPATAALVLWLAAAMTPDAWAAAGPALAAALPWAIAVNAVVAWAGYRARTVTASGAIVGWILGVVIFAGGGWAAWVLLLVTFVLASVASHLGLERKQLLGIAEERGGRRAAGNALANVGVAAIAAIAAITTPHADAALVALVAALAAGGSDTVASEIGKAWGRSTFLVTSFGRVKPGTSGAMSLEGTAAGLAAAFGLAAIAAAFGLIAGPAIVGVAIAATLGALVESVLAGTFESSGILNNDVLNFVNTAVAAAIALALA